MQPNSSTCPRSSRYGRLVFIFCCLFVGLIGWSKGLLAQDVGSAQEDALRNAHGGRPYSPYAGGAVPNKVFWGDTHLHTSYSMDAGAFGNRLGPEEAYRFARGDEVESSTAGRARLKDHGSLFCLSRPHIRPHVFPAKADQTSNGRAFGIGAGAG